MSAVQNFNSPVFVQPPPVNEPYLHSQLNVNHLQTARFGLVNFSVNNMRKPSAALAQRSNRINPLSCAPTMAPEGKSKLFDNVDTYKRINQNPRTFMQYAEPLEGNQRSQPKSDISWKENRPETLQRINNDAGIRVNNIRCTLCRF